MVVIMKQQCTKIQAHFEAAPCMYVPIKLYIDHGGLIEIFENQNFQSIINSILKQFNP